MEVRTITCLIIDGSYDNNRFDYRRKLN